jgi:hypothetical protein
VSRLVDDLLPDERPTCRLFAISHVFKLLACSGAGAFASDNPAIYGGNGDFRGPFSPTIMIGISNTRSPIGTWLRSPHPTDKPALRNAWYRGSFAQFSALCGKTTYKFVQVMPSRWGPCLTSIAANDSAWAIWAANLVASKSGGVVIKTVATLPRRVCSISNWAWVRFLGNNWASSSTRAKSALAARSFA